MPLPKNKSNLNKTNDKRLFKKKKKKSQMDKTEGEALPWPHTDHLLYPRSTD